MNKDAVSIDDAKNEKEARNIILNAANNEVREWVVMQYEQIDEMEHTYNGQKAIIEWYEKEHKDMVTNIGYLKAEIKRLSNKGDE